MSHEANPAGAVPGPAPESKRASGGGQRLRADDGRLVRGRKSRAQIRAAAKELFREKGFDGATLRAIAARAGMGASSIYRHVQSKEELLIDELAELQEQAWHNFRAQDQRNASTRERVHRFLDAQHALLAEDKDLTTIALRATTRPEARVARSVLALNDRTIGLLIEVLQMGRKHQDLAPGINIMEAARALFHITLGARIPWANGLGNADSCRRSIQLGVDMLFSGLEA
jgi:AcrR family transcriptional regulator